MKGNSIFIDGTWGRKGDQELKLEDSCFCFFVLQSPLQSTLPFPPDGKFQQVLLDL